MDGNNHDEKGFNQGNSPKGNRKIEPSRSDFIKEAKVKTASYCAYQERTQQEVRDKLYNLGLHREEVEVLLTELITENFVNEERFAKTYARSKFNYNKWGRLKIKQGLQQKRISDYCQKIALQEIDSEDYVSQVEKLIDKKIKSIKDTNPWIIKNKAAAYVIGKGYESDLVWEVVNGLPI
ncbi:MAG: RecX family transcriptional regulator [Bacteroidetes bacterium]|nr:RecX family transcriptional regulator [Bacteroidota bacterium]MDA1121706.1 RecX family transcriptional regulator [Bacteroidota bacterium]